MNNEYFPLLKQWSWTLASSTILCHNIFDYVGKECVPEGLRIYFNGDVYGKEGFEDGASIHTSYISKIESVEHHYDMNGLGNELFRLTTESGSQYYVWSDKGDGSKTGSMIFVKDIISIAPIPDQPGCKPGAFGISMRNSGGFIVWPEDN